MTDQSWHADALCRQCDPDLWFGDDRKETTDHRMAVKICGNCPVRAMCLADALDREEPHGIWGGMTARERAKL